MFKIFNLKKDTYISQREPKRNFGKETQLYIVSGSHSLGNDLNPHKDQRALVWFSMDDILEDIPSGSINEYTFKLRSYLSDFRTLGNDFSVSCHPLLKSWDEGIGKEFNTNIGTSWDHYGIQNGFTWDDSDFPIIDDSGVISWDNGGGDYDDNILYSSSILDDEMVMETDITNYVVACNNGSLTNNGLIFIADKLNYNLAINSVDSENVIKPMVIAYNDDYNIGGSPTNEFSGDKSNMLIKPLHYSNRIDKGEDFMCILNIEERYRVSGFTYNRDLNYVENLSYKIHYDTTDQEIIPYSDYTRVSVNSATDSLYLKFSTKNMMRGLYWIKFKYDFGGVKVLSDKNYFLIE